MMFALVFMKMDYGPMKNFEHKSELKKLSDEIEKRTENEKNAKVFDLIIPIAVLIVMCVISMIYSGGFFSKESENYFHFINSFASSDASVGLVIGSFATLVISIIYFVLRRLVSFTDAMVCIPEGFKAMVPAILILSLAWTLKGMTDSLGAKEFVKGVVGSSASGFQLFLPAIIFVIACCLAFATGTSWGTFGILIPICIAIFPAGTQLNIISISACMAGAVCGDHCSPISDTTIMASAGSQCNHVNHVSTQLPYALTTAAVSFVCYIVAGIIKNPVVPLLFGFIFMFAILFAIKNFQKKK